MRILATLLVLVSIAACDWLLPGDSNVGRNDSIDVNFADHNAVDFEAAANTAMGYEANASTTIDLGYEVNTTASLDAGTVIGLSSGDPYEVILCRILQEQMTRRECNYYIQIWNQLELGVGALSGIPARMTKGDTVTVSFVVSRNPEAAPPEELLGTEPGQEFHARIGRRMAAQLRGDGFRVVPSALSHRDLFLAEGARWDWEVTALEAGRKRLILSAFVVIASPAGAQRENLLRSVVREVPVVVSWSEWATGLRDNMIAFLRSAAGIVSAATALVVAILLLISKFRKK